MSATSGLHKPCTKGADSRTVVGHARAPCWSCLARGPRRPPARPAARPGNGKSMVTYHPHGHAVFTPNPQKGSVAFEAVLARCGPPLSTRCPPRCTGSRPRRGGGGEGVHARPRRDGGWTPARGAVYQSAPAAAAVGLPLPGPPPVGAPSHATPSALLAHNGGGWHLTGRARVRGEARAVWEGPPALAPASLCHAPTPAGRLRRPPRSASLIPLKAAASRAEPGPRSPLYAAGAPRPVEPSPSTPHTRRALPHPALQPSPRLRAARKPPVAMAPAPPSGRVPPPPPPIPSLACFTDQVIRIRSAVASSISACPPPAAPPAPAPAPPPATLRAATRPHTARPRPAQTTRPAARTPRAR